MTSSDDAIAAQTALCRLTPKVSEPWARLARLLLDAGRPAEAIGAAETALALSPGNSALQALQAAALAQIQAMDPALAALELSAVLRPNDPAIPLELGHSYAELGQAQAAERAFKRVLALDAASAPAHAGLGALYLSVGIDDGAEHHSLVALQHQPGHAVASQTLAALLEARGDYAAAQARLDAAYARQSLFSEPAAAGRMTVLVLATQSSGNVPYRYVMPPRHYSRLVWYMEHARADQMATLPPYDVVFNAIGDPDLAGPSAQAVERFIAQCPRPLLNAPGRVACTRRDRLPDLLGDLDGVVAPRAIRVSSVASSSLAEAISATGLALPILARPTGSHGGKGLVRVDTADDLAAAGQTLEGDDAYLTEFHDYRSDDGRYRKGRVVFVDRRPYPYHWAVADHWLAHYETAGMGGAAERQAEELRFLQAPEDALGERAWRAIAQIGARLDLDYAGLDFSVLSDGRVLVFEANATMLVHPEAEDGEFAYKNPAVRRIVQAFQAKLAEAAEA
jgi:tetratricopeptide (TPR) repeat protein